MHMLVAQSLTVSHPLLRFLGKGAKSVFTTNETIVARIMVSGRTSFLIPIPMANFAQHKGSKNFGPIAAIQPEHDIGDTRRKKKR
jgi:hypothetical protein